MPARDVHLINADVDDAIFKQHGIKKDEEIVKTPQKCHICDMPNAHDAKMCSKCRKPLNLVTSLEIEEENKQQMINQDEKIENLENTIKDLQTSIEKRDKEWKEATMKAMQEMSEKFSNPEYIRGLQAKSD